MLNLQKKRTLNDDNNNSLSVENKKLKGERKRELEFTFCNEWANNENNDVTVVKQLINISPSTPFLYASPSIKTLSNWWTSWLCWKW